MSINEKNTIMVKGADYSYSFSRGLLAHSLELRGLSLEEAYNLARVIRSELEKSDISEINENELRRLVRDKAIEIVGKEIAYQYNIIEKWHNLNFPLIILVGAARGVQASSIAKAVAEKLAIPRITSTSTVSNIMRKMMSEDLSPELHEKSYLAHRKLRPIYSVLYDKILVGFEEHSRYPAEAVEALVNRAIQEGISLVIQGEHIVPRFISNELTNHPNVIHLTISIEDINRHKKIYLSNYNPTRHKKKSEHFTSVRKIHDYLVEESRLRNIKVIENKTINNVVEQIYKLSLNQLSKIISDKTYNEYRKLDPEMIHS